MSVSRRFQLVLAAGLVFIGGARSETYVDGFEGQVLNPFWTPATANGQVIFPATQQVHGGAQSVGLRLFPTNESGHGAGIYHNFAQPVYGEFSVWLYDSFPGNYNGNYALLSLYSLTDSISVGVMDWDGGKYWVGGSIGHGTPISRTLGWHELTIVDKPNEVKISIDGTLVHNGTESLGVVSLQLSQYGPSWRPSDLETYFDDFEGSYTNPTAVPEPASLGLLGLGLATTLGYLRCVRRKGPGTAL